MDDDADDARLREGGVEDPALRFGAGDRQAALVGEAARAVRIAARRRATMRQALRRIGCMGSETVPGGVVHELPGDLRDALVANTTALEAWRDITPLARNEFICWVEDARRAATRERRIRRTQEELEEGKRRPCCWPGCAHRERTGRAPTSP